MMLMFCYSTNAASAHWDFGLVNRDWDTKVYSFSGNVYGENGEYAWIHTYIYAHMENGGVYLKHLDFSGESMDPTFNWWALALYGDIVGEATFASHQPIELFYYNDSPDSGGTLVETPDDFYMVFKVSQVLLGEYAYEEGMTWYGWAHVSVDASLEMTLLGAGINLDGGAVIVGAGIPEPSGGMLMLLGVAVLALRRRQEKV